MFPFIFFFNDTATTEIYTLPLHDALPICLAGKHSRAAERSRARGLAVTPGYARPGGGRRAAGTPGAGERRRPAALSGYPCRSPTRGRAGHAQRGRWQPLRSRPPARDLTLTIAAASRGGGGARPA